jgi:hypothetical protein
MIARLLILTAGLFHLCLAQTFDVASIRASQFQSGDGEGSGRESIQTSADGLTMRNVTLQSCISWAYSVQDFQIAGGLGADRFDIVAKAGAPANVPTLRAMLGIILGERFNSSFIGIPRRYRPWFLSWRKEALSFTILKKMLPVSCDLTKARWWRSTRRCRSSLALLQARYGHQ